MAIEFPEGATPLDADEMEGLKFPHIATRGELDQLEQQNIQDGYRWLARQRKYKDFLSEEFLLELHRQFFGSVWIWAGSFRRSDKNIGFEWYPKKQRAIYVNPFIQIAAFAIVSSIIPSVCIEETNPASKAEGAKYTP